jgi:hypothetical protein
LELLAAATTHPSGTPLVPRPESAGTPARLANGELGNRPRGRRLAFVFRERGADQRPVHRTFVVARVVVFFRVLRLDRSGRSVGLRRYVFCRRLL